MTTENFLSTMEMVELIDGIYLHVFHDTTSEWPLVSMNIYHGSDGFMDK